jgi:putative membrane protein
LQKTGATPRRFTMMHFKSSLPKLSAAAGILACAACASNAPSSPNSAANAPTAAEDARQGANTTAAAPAPESYAATGAKPTSAANSDPLASGGTDPSGSATETGRSAVDHGPVGMTNTIGTDVSSLNDAQLAAVVQAINQGEVLEAQLAQNKAVSPETKRFAKDMMNVHREMQNRTNALLARLQMSPSENPVSTRLKTDVQNETSTLQTMRGRDFDRDYVDAQVRNHNKALELLDRITPIVKNPDLKAALASDRPEVEEHLRVAERIEEALQKGAANAQPASRTRAP